MREERADATEQVADFWSSPERQTVGVDWIGVERVARNVRLRSTGDPDLDWIAHSERFLAHIPKPRRALSLACGTGIVDRILRERDICQSVHGVDIAEGALDEARKLAAQAGLDGMSYATLDLDRGELPDQAYDVVYAHSALHHLRELEHVLDQVRRTLRPDGVFVVCEYVGPSQFQFPGKHLELADAFLRMIPARFRKLLGAGSSGLKEVASRASLAEMNAIDPSEAIRAGEIVPLVAMRFELVHLASFGGTLLLLVLNEIAGNFEEGDPEAEAILDALILYENVLLDAGVLPSYHAYLVGRKTANPHPMQTQRLWP
jgi:ubiquinone/menaquinone biosynthesis C-methylase UbiE